MATTLPLTPAVTPERIADYFAPRPVEARYHAAAERIISLAQVTAQSVHLILDATLGPCSLPACPIREGLR